MRRAPRFRHLCRLRLHEIFIKQGPSAPMTAAARHLPLGEIMESTAQKSCWGITVRAVLGFGIILVVAHLFGGI
jgi:hypothetical protein